MSQPADNIPERVTRLENQLAEVRYLARKADKDVSDFRALLTGHTGVLNAIREDQVEQGRQLSVHGERLDRLERKVDDGFSEIRAEMRENYSDLKAGQVQITMLLNDALDKPDETDNSAEEPEG